MTKFEKETKHRLYVFIRNNSVKCTTVRAFDTYCLITQARCLRCPVSAQIGLMITNHVREFCSSFDWFDNSFVKFL